MMKSHSVRVGHRKIGRREWAGSSRC